MKNVVVISSSLRNGSNSEILCNECVKGIDQSGNNVKYITLKDLNLKFYLGCLSCVKRHRCIQDDDINSILIVIAEVDVLVFGTPIYYYGLSGQLKTFLDRLNPLYGTDTRLKKFIY